MTRLSPPLTVVILALTMLFHGIPAQAQTSACREAAQAIRRAITLRTQHQDEAALIELKAAQAVCPTPQTQAQMALAEHALGRWLDAAEHLTAALAAPDDPWIKKHRTTLDSTWTVIDQHLGHLDIQIDPVAAGATVTVNGEPQGTLPLAAPVRVVSGTVVIDVQAPGYSTVHREVSVLPGGLAREQIQLTALAPEPAPILVHKEVTQPVAPPSRRMLLRTLGIINLTSGFAVLSGGVAAHVIREQAARAWNADESCVTSLPDNRPPQCADRLRRVMLGQSLAIIGYTVGGVLATSGIVLLALSAPVRSRDRAHVALIPGPGDVGLGVAGTF